MFSILNSDIDELYIKHFRAQPEEEPKRVAVI